MNGIRNFSKKTLLVLLVPTVVITSTGMASKQFEISKQIDIFISMFEELHTYYVDEINTSQLFETGIEAMLESLDPYTKYISASEVEDYKVMTTGEYGGIGAVISKEGAHILIVEPHEGYPAHQADLRAGDILLKVDDKSIKGKGTNEVSELLKGEPDTKVDVTIERPGFNDTLHKTLTRKNIEMPNVPYAGMIEDENVGYIRFNNFRKNASEEVKEEILNLKKRDSLRGLILDLRGNPGGILNEAVKTVSWFVNKGQLVVKTKGKVDEWNKTYKTYTAPVDKNIPLTVLVDGESASASEIVSGTMQDLDRGVVVGKQTYGKGLVQQAKSLPYNAKLKLTIAEYYIPSGRGIQARNYSQSNRSPEEIPDSSEIKFETKNGRTVHDGDGITPDVKVDPEDRPKIIKSLLNKRLIFDYATLYRNNHDTIPSPNEFKFTDEMYKDFVKFLNDREYEYTTNTEKKIKQLVSTSKDENYYAGINNNIDQLKENLKKHKQNDLELYKNEIQALIEKEIISRYYYQAGRIEASLENDEYVQKGLDVLTDSDRYYNILNIEPRN